jgi:hypothetical protein
MAIKTWIKHTTQGAKRACTALAAVAALSLGATSALATPFPNPAPGTLSDDIDGNGYFNVAAAGSLAVELVDAFDSVASFGFFDKADPGTLIPIFEASDLAGEVAIIDFVSGLVLDFEDAAPQNAFTPAAVIGFYLDLGIATLFSDPLLNGGADVMAAYTDLGSGALSLLFFDAPAGATQQTSLLSWHVLDGLRPEQVPVPATLLLMLAGIAGLAHSRRRRA